MYGGKYSKNRNYRPVSSVWTKMKKAQSYMDQKTTGWYVNGRKPSWINKTSYWLRSYANTKYRFESD